MDKISAWETKFELMIQAAIKNKTKGKMKKTKQKKCVVAVCMALAMGVFMPILLHAIDLPVGQAQGCANTENGAGYGSQAACCEAACQVWNPDQNGNHTLQYDNCVTNCETYTKNN